LRFLYLPFSISALVQHKAVKGKGKGKNSQNRVLSALLRRRRNSILKARKKPDFLLSQRKIYAGSGKSFQLNR
jgi:hypothetical protein